MILTVVVNQMGSSCSALCRGDNDKHTNISSVTTYDFKFNKSGGVDISALNARLIGNGASNIACLHTQQGKKGTNQDAMIAWEVRYHLSPLVLELYFFFLSCLFFGETGMTN